MNIRRILSGLFAGWLIAGTAQPGGAATPQLDYRSANSVPTPWKRYAQLVEYDIQDRLGSDDPAAYRLHVFLENRILNAPQDTPPEGSAIISLWIDQNGIVTKVEFASLGDGQADKDLYALLTGQRLSEVPPADMLMPLRLRVALDWRT